MVVVVDIKEDNIFESNGKHFLRDDITGIVVSGKTEIEVSLKLKEVLEEFYDIMDNRGVSFIGSEMEKSKEST